MSLPLLMEREPQELLVHQEAEPCPYLPGEEACFPMRLPLRHLTPAELDQRLAEGDRRHGVLLYRPTCAACDACEPIRLDVTRFVLGRSHRRILRRGRRDLTIRRSAPTADMAAVALYDRHRFGRGLAQEGAKPIGRTAYERFLVERCCASEELRVYADDALVAVAIFDRGQDALSAVYCHHEPAMGRYSLGTYCILEQILLARAEGHRYLYLGLYIAGCDAMAYKARFLPHQRLIGGGWRDITASGDLP